MESPRSRSLETPAWISERWSAISAMVLSWGRKRTCDFFPGDAVFFVHQGDVFQKGGGRVFQDAGGGFSLVFVVERGLEFKLGP